MRLLASAAELRPAYDLVVVGAGPAGMAAASTAAATGARVLVVDENPSFGGQVYRAIAVGPLRDHATLGDEYHAGTRLAAGFAESMLDWLPGGIAWHLDEALGLGISHEGRSALVQAGRVVLATGALERPFPVQGWTLPGVMSVGAGQTVLKSSGLAPAGRVVLAGCGPLLWLYAAQCIAAGAPPSLVLDTTAPGAWGAAAPHMLAFLGSPYLLKGLRLMGRVRRAVPVRRATQLAIALDSAALRVAWDGGEAAADHVLLHQGVVPNLNLARAAGCDIRWDEGNACFVPVTDGWGNTSVGGILLAGDGAGIAGAEAAALRGQLAALAALAQQGRVTLAQRDRRAAPLRARLARWRKGRPFLDALNRPAPQFRTAPDEVLACRCEEVTGGQVRAAARLGATGPNQLKAWLRCGMGPCQGRMCGLTITETIAEARGTTCAEVGYLQLRSPVKPITLREFATLPRTEAEMRAVERR